MANLTACDVAWVLLPALRKRLSLQLTLSPRRLLTLRYPFECGFWIFYSFRGVRTLDCGCRRRHNRTR